MIVTQYSPWHMRGNAQAQQALHRFFNHAAAGETARTEAPAWQPPVDIREEATRFVILADLPGVDMATVDIQMDKGVLSLKGARDAVADEAATFARVERGHGGFDRRFTLPDSADAEAITAAGKNGVLEISIPKKADAAPRRIAING